MCKQQRDMLCGGCFEPNVLFSQNVFKRMNFEKCNFVSVLKSLRINRSVLTVIISVKVPGGSLHVQRMWTWPTAR